LIYFGFGPPPVARGHENRLAGSFSCEPNLADPGKCSVMSDMLMHVVGAEFFHGATLSKWSDKESWYDRHVITLVSNEHQIQLPKHL
jgi:hypothetical protein